MGDRKPWQWDFDGACKPGAGVAFASFSVGIFQWIPKSGRAGQRGELKRGKAVRRVRGLTSDPEPAYQRAREIVADLNARRVGFPQEA